MRKEYFISLFIYSFFKYCIFTRKENPLIVYISNSLLFEQNNCMIIIESPWSCRYLFWQTLQYFRSHGHCIQGKWTIGHTSCLWPLIGLLMTSLPASWLITTGYWSKQRLFINHRKISPVSCHAKRECNFQTCRKWSTWTIHE